MSVEISPAQRLGSRIPSNFIVGAATSSWQIEGDSRGRGRSIWDDFAERPGAIKDGTRADPAVEHVARLEEDLDLLKWLGVDSYRFSVSWPRVMPGGSGKHSQKGIDFYDRLIDGLLARGIAPALTMYHWDLPSELEAKGGWTSPEIGHYFADYADLLGGKFADRVESWATFNEPWVTAFLGHAATLHAPGRGKPAEGLEAAYRQLVAHARAMPVLRSHGAKNPGIVLNLTTIISDDPACQDAVMHVDGLQNRLWLDPLAGRGLPEDVIEKTKHISNWAFVDQQDLESISTPIDWLGINYYTPNRVIQAKRGEGQVVLGQNNDVYPGLSPSFTFTAREPKTEMGWEIHAPSIRTTLEQTASRLPGVPLYITENGGAFPDKLVGGRVLDHDRTSYYENHISQVLDAREAGVDVRGYYAWSLMDNIEWAEGLAKRFGIFHVDFATQRRTPKLSAEFLREMIASRN